MHECVSCLGLHVVGDVVHGAPQGDLADGPGGVIGQVGGQHTDPQLSLWRGGYTHAHIGLTPITNLVLP